MKTTWTTAAVACVMLLAGSPAHANPLPVPVIEATQGEASQDVTLAIKFASSSGCISGTIYRGKVLVPGDPYQNIDLNDGDTVVVAEVTGSQFASTPDAFSDGVTHCTLEITEVCVVPDTYYYQMFSGDSAVTWIDTGEGNLPILVQELDATCLPDHGGCSISAIPRRASRIALAAAPAVDHRRLHPVRHPAQEALITTTRRYLPAARSWRTRPYRSSAPSP